VVASKLGAVASKSSISSKSKNDLSAKPSVTPEVKAGQSSAATKMAGAAPGTLARDSSGTIAGVVDKDGKVVTATPGKFVEDKDGKLLTGTPGTLVKNGGGTVTGIYGSDGRLVSASPGTVIDKGGRIVSRSPGTVYRDSSGLLTGIAGGDGKSASTTTAATTPTVPPIASAPPASVTTPMTTQGPPPARISSLSVVSTSLSGVLGNGNVEVLLNVVARDTAGAVVNAPPINGWKVNGQLQTKPDGAPADGPVIPVSLPPGTHRISTVGKGSDGQPFQTDADVVVSPKGN